jgi:hypothetical protein
MAQSLYHSKVRSLLCGSHIVGLPRRSEGLLHIHVGVFTAAAYTAAVASCEGVQGIYPSTCRRLQRRLQRRSYRGNRATCTGPVCVWRP